MDGARGIWGAPDVRVGLLRMTEAVMGPPVSRLVARLGPCRGGGGEAQGEAAQGAGGHAVFYVHIALGEFDEQFGAHHFALLGTFEEGFGNAACVVLDGLECLFDQPEGFAFLCGWCMRAKCHWLRLSRCRSALIGFPCRNEKGAISGKETPL